MLSRPVKPLVLRKIKVGPRKHGNHVCTLDLPITQWQMPPMAKDDPKRLSALPKPAR
jgi:hypothetical protein